MDLAGALVVAGTTARMPVPGDAEDLLKQVLSSQAVPQGKVLSLAYHPPGVLLRPVEALHLLSLVTAPAYSADDLYDAYAWWGLLRYLGFFDHEAGIQAHPALRVSQAGAQVADVQRRVASEELGIAFGVLLASMRVRYELGPGVPVGIADVDVLLRGSRAGSSRRPDYLLVARSNRAVPDGMAYFLECKGTNDPRARGRQLTAAIRQITGPVPGCPAHAGLAVSTVAGATQVSCVALELTDSDVEEPGGSGQEPRYVSRADPARGTLPGSPDVFISAALRSSWSMLGHYAGNETAVRRWSDETRKPGGFSRAPERRRVLFESEYGPAVGVSTGFDLGDRQLIAHRHMGNRSAHRRRPHRRRSPGRAHRSGSICGNWTRSTRARKAPTTNYMRQPTHPSPGSSSRRASRSDP